MIRIGLVGCGAISNVHASAINGIQDAVLYGVCDYNYEKAKDFAKEHNVKAFESFEQMLEDSNIDCISLCTPSGLHAEQTIQALKKGKHVLTEKPMALNTSDCKRVIETEKQTGKKVSVVSQLRFREDVLTIKQLVKENRFGKLTNCDLYIKYYREPDYYASSPWRGTLKMDGGGALINQGVHGVDVMNFILGKPKIISSNVDTTIHKIEAEDNCVALLRYPNGASGIIQASTATPPGFPKRVLIHGEKGFAELTEGEITQLYLDGEYKVKKPVSENANRSNTNKVLDFSGHQKQYQNFINAITNEEALVSSSQDGLNSLEVIENIYQYR